jgi:hypothetical protein
MAEVEAHMQHCFHFTPASADYRSLIHIWLTKPHVAEWFYGQGLENTIKYLVAFLQGDSKLQSWFKI